MGCVAFVYDGSWIALVSLQDSQQSLAFRGLRDHVDFFLGQDLTDFYATLRVLELVECHTTSEAGTRRRDEEVLRTPSVLLCFRVFRVLRLFRRFHTTGKGL